MRRDIGFLVFFLVATLTGTESQGEVIEWKVTDGGNGHFYELIATPLRNWPDANSYVSTLAHPVTGQVGVGYLATLPSAAENSFVFGSVTQGVPAWIGARKYSPQKEWQWIAGVEAGLVFWNEGPVDGVYNNWRPGAPNDQLNEDYAGMNPLGLWGDSFDDQYEALVVEWNAVPEPSTLALFAMFGLIGAFVAWRKRKRS